MRSQIGLAEGGEVDIAVHGAAILIEPVAGADLQKEGRYLVIPPTGSAIDDDTVRESRLADQR